MPKISHSSAPPGAPAFSPRWVILLVFAFLIVARIVVYGGPVWIVLLSDLLIEGFFAALWLISATLIGWLILARSGLCHPNLSKSLLFATAAALGLGLIGLLTLVLGLAGWLNRYSAAGMLICLALPQLILLLQGARSHDFKSAIRSWLTKSIPAEWLLLLLTPFLAITLTGAMLPPGLLWKNSDDPHPYDVMEYHLQIPREWYEAGRILPLHHNAFSYFPMNAEMHDLLAMHLRGGPWDGMYLAQLTSAFFMCLAILAVYGICRTLLLSRGQASRRLPLLAAILAASTPWIMLLAPVAYVEAAMLLFATLSIGWTLIAFPVAEHRVRRMAVAGALAGLACGVKYTAVPMTLLAVPICLFIFRPRLLASLAVYVLVGLAAFSPWLIRNAIWTGGNPIFPEGISLFGPAHFSPDQVDRWQQAHAPRPDQRTLPARLHAAADQILLDWRYGYLLIPLALLCAIFSWRQSETRLLFTLLLVTTLIWLFATHLQSRFFVSAIPFCALLIGLAPLWQRFWIALAILVGVSTLFSYVTLNQQLTPYLGPFGITDFKPALPEAYVQLADKGRSIALVGQAQAFFYQIPMTRLSYRTVFDVNAAGASDPLAPWLGPNPRPDQYLLVYPSELARFSQTYAHIPPPPPSLFGQLEPIVIPPTK